MEVSENLSVDPHVDIFLMSKKKSKGKAKICLKIQSDKMIFKDESLL